MVFESLCAALIALLLGLAICFAGYRFFLALLPIWGFFAGFFFGAQTLQAIFGVGFLSTVTSWVVGFFTGAIFAVLSYLFYIVAVALAAGAFGYALGVGLMGLIGIDFGALVWIVGVVVGIALAAATILLNLQKWVIILITSFGGAGVIVGTFLFALGKLDTGALVANPVRQALADSPFWLVIFLVIGILGVVAQFRTNLGFELDPEQRPY